MEDESENVDENENVDETGEEEEFDIPSYGCNERYKDGFVHVTVWIKGLRTSSGLVLEGFLPKIERKPENAKVDMTFETKSLCLTVFGESGALKWKKFQLKVFELPHEIVPEESYYEVGEDRVELFMCKKEDISWCPQLDDGLETAEGVDH